MATGDPWAFAEDSSKENAQLKTELQNLKNMLDDLMQSGALSPLEKDVLSPVKAQAQDLYLKKQTKKEPGYVSHDKKVVGIALDSTGPLTVPKELFLITAEELELGIPVQIQLEITPDVSTGTGVDANHKICEHGYHASISEIKARVKPGYTQFSVNEEKVIDHILNGTEEEEQQIKREACLLKKHQEKDEVNRFTGLEIET